MLMLRAVLESRLPYFCIFVYMFFVFRALFCYSASKMGKPTSKLCPSQPNSCGFQIEADGATKKAEAVPLKAAVYHPDKSTVNEIKIIRKLSPSNLDVKPVKVESKKPEAAKPIPKPKTSMKKTTPPKATEEVTEEVAQPSPVPVVAPTEVIDAVTEVQKTEENIKVVNSRKKRGFKPDVNFRTAETIRIPQILWFPGKYHRTCVQERQGNVRESQTHQDQFDSEQFRRKTRQIRRMEN